MYPVKVKDYTRLGGWLALFAVLTALCSVNCLLALVRIPLQLATYGTYGMGLYYVLEGVNLVVGALGAAWYRAACAAERRRSAPRVPYYGCGEYCGFRAGTGRPDSVFCAQPGNCAKRAVQCAAGCFLWNMVFVSASFAPRGRLLRRGAAHVVRVRPARALRRAAPLWGARPAALWLWPPGRGPAALWLWARRGPAHSLCRRRAPMRRPPRPQPPQQAAVPFAYQPQAAQSSVPPARACPGRQATPAQPGPGAMVCPACGMQGAPGASFCTVCGAHLVPAAQAPAQPKEGEPHV